MTENQTPAFIFISYSRADGEFVTRLMADLQSQGINIWIDQKGLQPGTPDWEDALRNAAHAAHAVLLIASPNARSSRYVKDELRIAEMYQRPVFPVWATGAQWMDSIPLGWGGTQFIDAREARYTTAVGEIVITLRKVLSTTPSLSTTAPQPDFEPRNPYKGLRAFNSEDAPDFFGRGTLISELALLLQTYLDNEKKSNQSARLLTVIGPSGSGKSSVVRAGLLPRLQAGLLPELPGSKEWVYLDPMVPGIHPLESLTLALQGKIRDKSMKAIREDLDDDSARGLHLLASSLVKRQEAKVVLFVDQFEELFTQTIAEDERLHFIDLLVTAITEPQGPVLAILTLRADFYDRPMHYTDLGKLIEEHHKSVLPMEMREVRDAIQKPAMLADVQLNFEGDLVGDLLFEVQGQVGALPLLQFTLDQLFQRRNGHQLTLQAYKDIGGVKGALAQHAESTYEALPSDEYRTLARVLFLRLIDPGTTEQDTTRRRAALSELSLADAEQTRKLGETADAFIGARLLMTNEIAGITTIEVSHEALIREWKRLAEWLRTSRDDILLQKAISEDAAEWKRHGKPAYLLYRDEQLSDAQRWAARNVPSSDEVAFLQSSDVEQKRQKAEQQAQQTRELSLQRRVTSQQRRLISLMGVASIVLLLALVGALFLSVGLQNANQELKNSLPVNVTSLKGDGSKDSLSWAITNAHDGDTITFAPGLSGVIKLTKTLEIKKDLTIIGPGANVLSISGRNQQRVFQVDQGATVSISNVTITKGRSGCYGNANKDSYGGGIFNDNGGTLMLFKSIVSENVACYGGGIFNEGLLILSNSTITNNKANDSSGGYGGGIFNFGTLNLLNSMVSGNGAMYGGGGIFNSYKLGIANSTIYDNSTDDGNGGGINNFDTSALTLTNSTLFANTASGDGGGIVNSGSGSNVYITYCTIYDNAAKTGGGIKNEISKDNNNLLSLEASIVAGDSASNGPDISGNVTLENSPSLIQSSAGTILHYDGSNSTLLTGVPNVGPLKDNGGFTLPHTLTLPLLPNSSAIDKIASGSSSLCNSDSTQSSVPTDQRGFPRPKKGGGCDLGAYQTQ